MTSYHPPEFEGLTRHETNLLACCYNMPGFTWPSGKKAYAFCHSRAYGFYMKRLRERYTKTNSQGRLTYQQRIIDIGTIDQHSVEYQNKLRDRGIVLPSIAFADTTPNFVVDILSLPEQTLRNYGFIPITVSNKNIQIASYPPDSITNFSILIYKISYKNKKIYFLIFKLFSFYYNKV